MCTQILNIWNTGLVETFYILFLKFETTAHVQYYNIVNTQGSSIVGTQNFPKNLHILPRNMYTQVSVSGVKNVSFF